MRILQSNRQWIRVAIYQLGLKGQNVDMSGSEAEGRVPPQAVANGLKKRVWKERCGL